MSLSTADTPLILASTSPYRAELLQRLGLTFETAAPDVDETPLAGESPDTLALRLARAKAAAVAAAYPEAVVLGSDQVGQCAGRLLTKPGDKQRAVAELRALSGQPAVFYTAIAVQHDDRCEADVVTTELRFRDISEAEARVYVERDEPWDCAGSFKAEALGIALFEQIRADDPTALIGLPLIATVSLLGRFGIKVLG